MGDKQQCAAAFGEGDMSVYQYIWCTSEADEQAFVEEREHIELVLKGTSISGLVSEMPSEDPAEVKRILTFDTWGGMPDETANLIPWRGEPHWRPVPPTRQRHLMLINIQSIPVLLKIIYPH